MKRSVLVHMLLGWWDSGNRCADGRGMSGNTKWSTGVTAGRTLNCADVFRAQSSTCNVSATHRHFQICKCHGLHIILAFPQNMSYHVHITCLWPGFLSRDGGGVTGDKAAKTVTGVWVCVSTCVSVRPLGLLQILKAKTWCFTNPNQVGFGNWP